MDSTEYRHHQMLVLMFLIHILYHFMLYLIFLLCDTISLSPSVYLCIGNASLLDLEQKFEQKLKMEQMEQRQQQMEQTFKE